jgi:hypothetical protein
VSGPGRPRAYCRQSCRQRDYEARRRAHEAGLGEAEVIIGRSELDELHDRLYELQAAIEDVERDLAGNPPARAYREAVEWLLTAARPAAALLDRT